MRAPWRWPPNQIIGEVSDPYLRRWFLIPKNRWMNLYLHHFMRSDDDRALHDHPWWNVSLLLSGHYIEHVPNGTHIRCLLNLVFRRAATAHRIELVDGPVWTLFLTGPKVREWGFHCPASSPAGGWRHWRDFTNPADGGRTIGRGCE